MALLTSELFLQLLLLQTTASKQEGCVSDLCLRRLRRATILKESRISRQCIYQRIHYVE